MAWHRVVLGVLLCASAVCGCACSAQVARSGAVSGAKTASTATRHGGRGQGAGDAAARRGRLLARDCAERLRREPQVPTVGAWRRRFHTRGYDATVFNPGSSDAFTAFVEVNRAVRVTPGSAAYVREWDVGRLRFPSARARSLWRRAGAPTLASGRAHLIEIPAGRFGYLPNGTPLTYGEARAASGTPAAMRAMVVRHLRAYSGTPSGRLLLKQYGFLLAAAPLGAEARSAVFRDVVGLAGVYACRGHGWVSGRDVRHLCVRGASFVTAIAVNTASCEVEGVDQRLSVVNPGYPGVDGGATVEAVAFVK